MIRSMTGYGKASVENGDKTITVEIRALNSKGADINLRLSSSLRNYELELRNEISRQLERGKIDLSVSVDSLKGETPVEINVDLARSYFKQLEHLAHKINQPITDPIGQLLKMPDVLMNEKKETDEKEFALIKACMDKAIKQVNQFREAEGRSLQKDFEERIARIALHLKEVEAMDQSRIESIRSRIKNNLNEVIGVEKVDQDRFEQELIYYIEKLDINEEKVRLKTHLDYFLETCRETSPGRKLNFISQEIGREINTIGSKANHAGMQKLVVLMKDELEKIKEQANNVL